MRITIKWTAFKDSEGLAEKGRIGNAEMTFVFPTAVPMYDAEVLNYLFECTNLYQGRVWKEHLEDKMPANRSHTALSAGDEIVLDGREYRCEFVGWKEIKTGLLAC